MICNNTKKFDYNDNFNLYSLKLNNEVGAKLEYVLNSETSSYELRLVSKTNKILSKIDIASPEYPDIYIQSVEFVLDPPSLVVRYENHEPIVCDLSELMQLIPKITVSQDVESQDYTLNINY